MDHEFFKVHQTAAVYAANGVKEMVLEKFELHLMSCGACVDDVEIWRTIKENMPGRREVWSACPQNIVPFMD